MLDLLAMIFGGIIGGAPDDTGRDMGKATRIMAAVFYVILVIALAVAIYAALS